MPGLVGVIEMSANPQARQEVAEVLPVLLAPLRHHADYHTETYLDRQQGIAIARLHLGILNSAPQPYIPPHGRFKLFLHGEIYNDAAPPDHQLPYLAQLYDRLGPTFVAQLNGSFVLLLLDDTHHRLLIATDRTASKPLFYAVHRHYLYFAPELKALAQLPALPKTLDLTALASFLSAGYFLNGHTLLQAVQLVDNATLLQLTPTGLTTHKYWDYVFEEPAKDHKLAYYQRTLSELLRTAVRRRLRTPHRYGILLSGGYDSRGLLGCYLAEGGPQPVHTISWGVAEDIPHSDCAIARRLAGQLGTQHSFYPLRPARLPDHLRAFVYLHDGLTDAVANYPEALAIFHHIRHVLGLHILLRGDECFGFSQPACDEKTIFEKFSLFPLNSVRLYAKILSGSYCRLFTELNLQTMCELSKRCSASDICHRQNFYYLDQRIKYYLNPLNYFKSLEVEIRTPYLDNDILDFMRQLPLRLLFGKQFYRRAIVKEFPSLFREVATRTNLPEWSIELRNPIFKDFFYKILFDKENSLQEFIELDLLLPTLEEFFSSQHHGASTKNLVQILRKLLVRSPSAYRFVQKSYRSLRRQEYPNPIPLSKIIFRLLTLKLSIDYFGQHSQWNSHAQSEF